MPATGPRAKYWCFTLNNYTADDVARLSAPIAEVEYMVFGKEVGESGTPHLQGTICFQTRKRMLQVKALIGHNPHLEVVKYLEQSIEYCKKDGDFRETGIQPSLKKGQRSDLEDFKRTVKDEKVTEMSILRELHSEVCARYPRFVTDYVDQHKEKFRVPPHLMRPWQQTLFHRLELPPSPREIIFVVDKTGNQGKSWLCRYYCDLHDNGQIIVPGKKADMAYVVRENARVFFIDCPRSKQGEYIQYDFLEELKNGYIFSPKYESRIKRFGTPHVVVFMNETPDMSKLSRDRYSITNLSD